MIINPPGRDLRIDLIRGLALWMILSDHIDHNWVRHLTYRNFGASTATEIFVFLSGLSCCLLYGKLLARAGFVAAQIRALHRVLQIYIGYIFVVFISFALVLACRDRLDAAYLTANDFDLLVTAPAQAMGAAAYLYYTPQFLDILPLYLLLLAAAPLMVLGLERAAPATLAASVAIWLAAETMPWFNLPNLVPSGVAGSNPFSWQLLFCLGLWVGKHYYLDQRRFQPAAWLKGICWAVVAAHLMASLAIKIGQGPGHYHVPILERLIAAPGTELVTSFRLSHFLAVAYLTASYLPVDAALLRHRWWRPLTLSGRHSLEVFCGGVLFADAANLGLGTLSIGPVFQLLVNLAGWGGLAGLAWLLDIKNRQPHAAPAAGPRRALAERLPT